MNRFRRVMRALTADRTVVVGALGLAPLAAVTDDPLDTVVLLGVFLVALTATAATVGVLRNLISSGQRVLVVAVVSSLTVAVVEQLLTAFLFEQRQSLGIYVGVVAMNSLLLDRCERMATGTLLTPEVPLYRMRAAYFRALAGTGASVVTIVGLVMLVRVGGAALLPVPLAGAAGTAGLAFLASPGGALVALGLVLAMLRWITGDADEDDAR